mmetsp:Transcript_17844/g.44336  ORF Transcript_17844/g.44336 Transcript_17844/m.44336 type:complete len:216 (+) Transcript_17844:220-867(+)
MPDPPGAAEPQTRRVGCAHRYGAARTLRVGWGLGVGPTDTRAVRTGPVRRPRQPLGPPAAGRVVGGYFGTKRLARAQRAMGSRAAPRAGPAAPNAYPGRLARRRRAPPTTSRRSARCFPGRCQNTTRGHLGAAVGGARSGRRAVFRSRWRRRRLRGLAQGDWRASAKHAEPPSRRSAERASQENGGRVHDAGTQCKHTADAPLCLHDLAGADRER